jgi:hypothetical protein
MNPQKIADALNTIAVAFGELAEAINESGPVRPESGAAGIAASPAAGHPAAPFEASPFAVESTTPVEYIKTSETMQSQPTLADESVEFADQGSEAMCPAHHKPFIDGKFGKYCPGKGIDPAWTNKRGYCTVNPGNVATYLRIKAAA